MKRKISICMIVITVIVVAAVLINNYREEPEAPIEVGHDYSYSSETTEEQPEELVPVNAARVAYAYILRAYNGRVAVYRPDSDEIYMETSILVESLPAEVFEDLKDGIGFQDEAGLFDFLESYSS